MPVNLNSYKQIYDELQKKNVTLVAVSKTKPAEDILELYKLGERDFGENYVQELVDKYEQLPKDIRWHFIGHLQSNKVKYIAPFVSLIEGVDSKKLLTEIDKQGRKDQYLDDRGLTGLSVLMGGGRKWFLPSTTPGSRGARRR